MGTNHHSPAAYTSQKRISKLPHSILHGIGLGIGGRMSVSSAICFTLASLRWICTCGVTTAAPTHSMLASYPNSIAHNLDINNNSSLHLSTSLSASSEKAAILPASINLAARALLPVNSSRPANSDLSISRVLPASSTLPSNNNLIVNSNLTVDSPPPFSNL